MGWGSGWGGSGWGSGAGPVSTFPEANTFALGAVTYPLATVETTLFDADPAIWYALDFFGTMLDKYLGARIRAAAASTGVKLTTPIVNPFIQTNCPLALPIPLDPTPYFPQTQFTFPLLAMWRRSSVFESRTVVRRHVVTNVGIAFVLHAMTPTQSFSVLPILAAVRSVIEVKLQNGWDPSYQNGSVVWGKGFANLESIELASDEYRSFAGMSDLQYPAWVGTITLKERVMAVPGAYPAITGNDTTISQVADDGTGLPLSSFEIDL